MKSEYEVQKEIKRIKINLTEAIRSKNNPAEIWIRGYWTALGWVLKYRK